jgi:dienelactone hydrolase
MHPPRLLFAVAILAALGARVSMAQPSLGEQGPEGEPHRRQQWLIPSPDPATAAHAVLFRPPGKGPFPLAVIAHASTQNVLRRAQMPQPEYRALAGWLVGRGFAVLVPERPGHGATGGKYLEDQGDCDEADYARSGRVVADAIAAATGFIRKQPFIRAEGMVVIGHSAGPGVHWRWPAKIRRTLPPSSRSRRGAAGMPMILSTASARRTC